MPEEKEAFSVYEKVRQHDETLDAHEDRIGALEESERKQEARIKLLEDNAVRLENTVMSEARETRSTMERNTDRLFDIVKNAMSFSATQEEHKHQLRLTKWDKVTTILLKAGAGLVTLASAGGAVYYVIENFVLK